MEEAVDGPEAADLLGQEAAGASVENVQQAVHLLLPGVRQVQNDTRGILVIHLSSEKK